MIPLLIIRGWRSRFENWQKFITLLEKQGCKIYSPDLPGFGNNPPPKNVWSVDDYVEWVKDFCEKNNVSQFFLMGHSFGGAVVVKYLLKYPQNIKGLILVGAAVVRRKTLKKWFFARFSKIFKIFFPASFRKIIYKFIFRKSDYPSAEGIMKDIYLKVIKEDLTDCLSKITLPALIVWGEKDDSTPVKNAYLIKEKISGPVTLEIFSGVYHNPHREVPEKLTEIITKFLRP